MAPRDRSRPTTRTGVLGGTFNPLHLGHLLVADDVRRRCRLDKVLFLAGPRPPHKPSQSLAPWHHRREMLRRGIANWPHFALSDVEEEMPGPAYTVAALERLRTARPGVTLCLIIGADQYRAMSGWHEPGRLTELARIVVMSRPGSDRPTLFPGHPARRVGFTPVMEVDISGSDIRARLAKGQSVRYMLPAPVCSYIEHHRLYMKNDRNRAGGDAAGNRARGSRSKARLTLPSGGLPARSAGDSNLQEDR